MSAPVAQKEAEDAVLRPVPGTRYLVSDSGSAAVVVIHDSENQ